MFELRQSTATAILIGPFIDDTDGKTPETGLTVTSFDVDLYKQSNTHPLTKTDLTITSSGGSNDCAHVANGYYSLELTATDTNTLGRLKVTVNSSGALPVWHEFEVVTANVWDSRYSTDYLQVDAVQVEGSDATDQINAACDTALADYDAVVPADLSTLATASALATVDANVDLILADTGTDGVAVSATVANKIADHTIRRSFQNACDSSDGDTKTFRSLLGAIAKLVNKIAVSGSTLTVYEDDDTTSMGTQTVTTDSGADPISGLDTT